MAWWDDVPEDVTKPVPQEPATGKQIGFLRRHWDQIRGLVSTKEYELGAEQFLGMVSKQRSTWLISELIRSVDEGIPLPKRPHMRKLSMRVPRDCKTCEQYRRGDVNTCGCEYPKSWPNGAAKCPGYRIDSEAVPPTMDGFDLMRGKRCLATWPDGSYAVVVPEDILPGEGILVRMGGEVYEIEFGSGPELMLLEE